MKNFFILLLTLFMYRGLTAQMPKANPAVACNTQDSLALVALFNALDGNNWYHNDYWLNDSVYKWYGVTINTAGVVSSVTLKNNNLSGTIPAEIGDFTGLLTLNLAENHLTGTIPSSITNLASSLRYLILSNNQLSGNIPLEIYDLTLLVDLELDHNQFNGEISTNIQNLSNLVVLNLSNNNLIGEIPREIQNLTNLAELRLSNNYLGGNLPAELYDLSNLQVLDLSYNQFIGTISEQIGNLTSLSSLILSHNLFTGAVPQALKNLTNLQRLYLDYNYFDAVGGDYSTLTNLTFCYLSYNNFEFDDLQAANLSALQYFYNRQRQIPITVVDNGDGTYTLSITKTTTDDTCMWYRYAGGYETFMNGETYPQVTVSATDPAAYYCVVMNTNYPSLYLYSEVYEVGSAGVKNGVAENEYAALIDFYNSLNGPSWSIITNWNSSEQAGKWYGVYVEGVHVKEINLTGNYLKGSIPASIQNLSSLAYLYLNNNMINDSVPAALANIPALVTVDLSNNSLVGIQQGLSASPNLRTLYLNNNQIKTLPADMNQFAQLRSLSLSNNLLSSLPDMNITNLSYCDISENYLDFGDLEQANFPATATVVADNQARIGTDTIVYLSPGHYMSLLLSTGGTNNLYQWQKDRQDISGATNADYIVSSASLADTGIYRCLITNTDFSGVTLYTHLYYVRRGYALDLQANPPGSGTLLGEGIYAPNTNVNISATASPGYVFDKWTDASGNTVSINTNYTFSITQDTLLIAHFTSTTTSVENTDKNSLVVYPVPATDQVYIRMPDNASAEKIFITDISGRRYNIQTKKLNGTLKANINGLPHGVYILTIITTGKQVLHKNLIIQ